MPLPVNNTTDLLRELARQQPERPAIRYCAPGRPDLVWSYAGLEELVEQYAAGWQQFGLAHGERVLFFARPDRHFTPFVLGLIRAGGSVVFVDPGRPIRELLECIRQAAPAVLVAPRPLHLLSALLPALRTVRRRVTTDGRLPGAMFQPDLLAAGQGRSSQPVTSPASESALIFTTGSTGQPKGVTYTHAILLAQCQALQSALNLRAEEIGLFGPSAMMLLGLMAGATAVLADALGAPPAQLDLASFARLLNEQRATFTFASPALCRRLAAYSRERGLTFPHLRGLMVGGAEVSPALIRELQALLPNGDVVISLGSTEITPVALIPGRQALALKPPTACPPGMACIGYPVPAHEVAIIPIRDEPIPAWDDALRLPPGQVGEIVIRGPAVTGAYLAKPELTARAKITAGDTFWHRMGDLGCLDETGCLWLAGRKTQRVETGQEVLFTIPCEAVFNQHPAVARSALVGRGERGQQTPVIVIEPKPGCLPRSAAEKAALLAELRALAQAHPHTRAIHDFVIYPCPFPVDIRHNSKISREKLLRGYLKLH